MSVAASLSKPIAGARASTDPLSTVRVDGTIRLTAEYDAVRRATRIATLAESGGYRVKFPDTDGQRLNACIVNTGGGVAGGDRVTVAVTAGAHACVAVTTPSAERIYRSLGDDTRISTAIGVASGADLLWNPSATILFSGARLRRTLDVSLAEGARACMAEIIVFGRRESGETLGQGLFHDHWSIRRAGRLIFADATRIGGNIGQSLPRAAVMGTANVAALVVAAAPNIDEHLDAVRDVCSTARTDMGASCWNGVMVVRALASRLDYMQTDVAHILRILQQNDPARGQHKLSEHSS